MNFDQMRECLFQSMCRVLRKAESDYERSNAQLEARIALLRSINPNTSVTQLSRRMIRLTLQYERKSHTIIQAYMLKVSHMKQQQREQREQREQQRQDQRRQRNEINSSA